MSGGWPVDVASAGPVACGAVVWRSAGALRVTVVVKATFGLVPDRDAGVIDPLPIAREDRHHGDDPARSVARASDLAPYLPCAGVVVTGHAYAASPMAVVAARVAIVGAEPVLDKTIHVFGDVPPGAREGATFQKMPLVYERAYGGPAVPLNPVGVGATGTRKPNLVHPANPHRPTGFGPVSPSWPLRRKWLEKLSSTEGVVDIPADFDYRAFHPAPSDQQVPFLRGDEWIVLDNLAAVRPRVQSRLPSAVARARWSRGGEPTEIPLAADMLAIDADAQAASLCWRGHFVVEGSLADVRVHAGLELPGKPIAWPSPPGRKLQDSATALISPFAPPTLTDMDTTAQGEAPPAERSELHRTAKIRPALLDKPALPFVPAAAGTPPTPPKRQAFRGPPLGDEETVTVPTMQADPRLAGQPATPFATPAPTISEKRAAIPGAPWSGLAASRVEPPEDQTLLVPEPARIAPPPEPARIAPPPEPARVASAPEPAAEPPAEPARPPPSADRDAARAGRARAEKLLAGGAPLDRGDFSGADLAGLDLSGRSLVGANLTGVDLTGAKLSGARLVDAILVDATLDRASFAGADLTGARLAKAKGEGADFHGATLARADLSNAALPGASFVEAALRGARADQADLAGARFTRADLQGASLRRAKLVGAVLAHALLDGADLRNADLERANLHDTARRTAKLAGANLKNVTEDPPG